MERALILTTPGAEALAASLLRILADVRGGDSPVEPGLFERDRTYLARVFGANSPERARLIAFPASPAETDYAIGQALELAGDPWGVTSAYAPNRVEAFRRAGFHVVGLFCSPQDSDLDAAAVEGFTRAYYAARESGEITGGLDYGREVLNRAWLWYWRHLLAADVPVIHAASLRHGDAREVCDALDAAGFYSIAQTAAGLILERRRAEALARPQG